MKKQKVAVALSGGKDSTAACLLLREQGFDVHALTMQLGIENEEERLAKIRHLTHFLDIPWRTVDFRTVFKQKVIDRFVHSYAAGLTPNPCVQCNVEIKFNLLLNEALDKENADFYATGHYADKTLIDGDYFLTEPRDKMKSQVYFLSMIGKQALQRVIFPISALTIEEVREKVKDLPLANTSESQDVCFLHDKKLIDFLKKHLPPSYFQPGDILDINGKTIGRHKGSVYFTVGQRRGTGFSSDRKLYVIKKNVRENTITLGEEKDLYTGSFTVYDPVYWKEIETGDVYKAKIRYLTPFSEVIITGVSPKFIKAGFITAEKSITPGQIGAFYHENIIVAAGYIGEFTH